MHVYELRPRKDHRSVDLISEVLPFDKLWYAEPNAVVNAIGYALHHSRSHDAVIRVYDESGNVIETHEHKGYFKECKSNRMKQKAPCGEARRLIASVCAQLVRLELRVPCSNRRATGPHALIANK